MDCSPDSEQVRFAVLENLTPFGYNVTVPRVFGQVDGFDVKVNRIEDQDEPHVHVYKGGIEYRISIVTGRVMTYGGRGTSTKAQGRRAERLVADNIKACWTEWNKWHKNKAQKRAGTANQRTRK